VIYIDGDHLMIATVSGTMLVAPGDYVICGVKGEFHPCRPALFEATYELLRE